MQQPANPHPHPDALAEAKIEDALEPFKQWLDDPANDSRSILAFPWKAGPSKPLASVARAGTSKS